MSSTISYDPTNSEVSLCLSPKSEGDILNETKLTAESAGSVGNRKDSDFGDADTLDDISESSILENDDLTVNTKTYHTIPAPEISPLKQAVKGYVLNRLKKNSASSHLLSGLSGKLVKRLEDGKESLPSSKMAVENLTPPSSEEKEILVDPISCELKSVVANESGLVEITPAEEAFECFEESKSSSSDSMGPAHLKVEKKLLSRSLPSSPAHKNGRRSSTGSDRFPVLDDGSPKKLSSYNPSNQLMLDPFVRASTLSEENEIELDETRMSSDEQEASTSDRPESLPQEYPENAFVSFQGDSSENPPKGVVRKCIDAVAYIRDVFLSLPLSHLLLLASVVVHNSRFLSSYNVTLVLDTIIMGYVCQRIVQELLRKEMTYVSVQPSYHDTRLERATMTFELYNKTMSGSVKILKGTFDSDEAVQSTMLVHVRVEDHHLKIFKLDPSKGFEDSQLPLETFYLCGATISLVPKGLIRRRAFRKRYPICITLPYIARKSSSLTAVDNLDEDQTDFTSFVPCVDGLVESKKERAIYLYALSNREKEAWFWALLHNTKICDKKNVRNTSPQPSCSSDQESMTYSTLLDTHAEESISVIEEQSGSTSITEIKLITDDSPSLIFENYTKSLMENYENDTDELYKRLEYFPGSNVEEQGRASCSTEWLNVVIGRLFFDFLTQKKWSDYVITKIQKKLDVIELPTFVESLKVTETAMGDTIPQLHSVSDPIVDKLGIWFDFDFVYNGSFQMTLQAKTRMPPEKQIISNESPDSSESRQNGESTDAHDDDGTGSKSQTPNHQSKLINKIEKWVSHKHFQTVAQSRFVKKYVGDFSNMTLTLTVEVKKLHGIMTLNIPPVPSDRIWFGFRNEPDLSLHAFPKVGTHQINIASIVQMIERKLVQAFKKALVLPNMDDVVIPIMFSPIYDQ